MTLLAVDGESAERKRAGSGKAQARASAPQWWREIDTGPFIADTFMDAPSGQVAALKGLAIKVGPTRDATLVFDTELLAWRAGFDGAVLLEGTPWSGTHAGNSHFPETAGAFYFLNSSASLGWALNGNWDDPRAIKSGPLPHSVGRYRGLYRHGHQVVLHYTVGGVKILEHPNLEIVDGIRVVTRTLEVAANPGAELQLLVRERGADDARRKRGVEVQLVGASSEVRLQTDAGGRTTVTIAKGAPGVRFRIAYVAGSMAPGKIASGSPLTALMRGGPAIFPQTFSVKGELDPNARGKTYAVDAIPLPADNPWKSPTRFGGFDFLPGGKRIAASTWNGDVWIADGIEGELARVSWRRFASGLFQTLGLKVVDGTIYTQGRDQITRLHDLNGDGEADYYECFNNDVMITAGFHEFSFDLETDRAGNFYFSKGMPVQGGGRGFMPWTPHNGTVMKVSKDGSKLEVVAWGLRAPGGVGVSPDGIITTGENEGSWVPACKISWTKPGHLTFNGVVPSKWEDRNVFAGTLPGAPTDYDRPLMWMPYYADNSSGSQAWVPSETKWDPRHAGELLHLSYGKSTIFRVLRDEVNGVAQGAAYRLPIDVSSAVMRARFHPENGQLYVVGFRGWQTNGRDALQRVRYTGVESPLPTGFRAYKNGLVVRFSAPLDPKSAEDSSRYALSKWNYVWGPMYGSGRFSIDERDLEAEERARKTYSKGVHNRIDTIDVEAARLIEDGRAVFLYIPRMTPAMQMELKFDVAAVGGAAVRETLYATVHECAPNFDLPGVRWTDIAVREKPPVGERGLIMSFDAEITDSVRVEQIALQVAEGTSPSVFMAPRKFGAAWQGSIVVNERDEYRFRLEGSGVGSLKIDGKEILSGELPSKESPPIILAKGSHAIYATYSSLASGEGRARLLWSSPQFRWEPVPPTAFRFLPGAELESWSKARAGREVFVAAQCIKCHAPRGGMSADLSPELLESVPRFDRIGQRLERNWLETWIAQPQGGCPTLAPDHTRDIAAYLSGPGGQAGEGAPVPTDAASIAAGGRLIESLRLGPWLEPMYSVRKHTDAGLLEFLAEPAKYHPDTAFPDVKLTRAEARQIAAYVRSRQPAAKRASGDGNASLGKTIVKANCAACHEPGAATRSAPSLEDVARADWTMRGCVAQNRGAAPNLRLGSSEVAALITFRNADRDVGMQSLRRFAPAEYASSQMTRLNCAHCHTSGGQEKIPDIALAGEKLRPDWVEQLLAGTLTSKTRPWLETRMPAFASRAENIARGLAAKHGIAAPSAVAPKQEALANAGAQLAGEKGYACVACHDAGTRKANQVFEGQGPNLQVAGERLNYDFYQRWMHWPQRISPATIMPRYTKDRDHALLDNVLDGDTEKQFDAIWQWIQTLAVKP